MKVKQIKSDQWPLLKTKLQWQVPDFTIAQFLPKKNKYGVCVFVINEGKKIQKQLEVMGKLSDQVDVIVADGGSTDGSLPEELLVKTKVRTLLTKTGPGKLSAQMRMALAYGLLEGYEGVVVIDGNNKDRPEEIPRMIKALEAGYDHVQGSRFIPGGKAINNPPARMLGLKLLHAPLISLAARFRYTDTTNGFRAYSRKLLLDESINIFREVFSTYELHYYLAIQAARKGYKVTEVPVTRQYPKGKVPTKISGLRGNLSILKILFKSVMGQYDV